MKRQHIFSGSIFEEQIGYSRAIVQDNWVFVSGTTGYDYKTMEISEDIVVQTEQCLKNIENALNQANASLSDVVRVNYILPDAKDFAHCWPILRKYFGKVRPAAMMIAGGLADPKMKIEIEVTALKQPLDHSKAILQAVRDFIQGGDNSDVTLLNEVLHQDYSNVQSGFFEEKGIFIIDKDHYIRLIREGTFGGTPRALEIVQLEVLGNLAYARIKLFGTVLDFDSVIHLIHDQGKWWIIGNYPYIQRNIQI
jgi:enamine deaminase RidA (YjgF/YER057c/UK114 family)